MSGKIEGIDEISGGNSRNKAYEIARMQMEKNKELREQKASGQEIQPDLELKARQGITIKTTSSEETNLTKRVTDNFSSEISNKAMKSGHAPVAISFADLSESKRQEFDKTSFVKGDAGVSVVNAASHIANSEQSDGGNDDRGSDEGNKQTSNDVIKENSVKKNKL